jgi:hypothetical protein
MVNNGVNAMQGICPVCNGLGKVPLDPVEAKYSYNAGKTHKECHNCGGQQMFGKGTGRVPLNKEGQPCRHDYVGSATGYRSLVRLTCKHCGHSFEVDSGD